MGYGRWNILRIGRLKDVSVYCVLYECFFPPFSSICLLKFLLFKKYKNVGQVLKHSKKGVTRELA